MIDFQPLLKDASDDQLWKWIGESLPEHASLASDELTRRRLKQLNVTIVDMNRSTSRYSDVIIVLTIMMAVIALLQLTATIFPVPQPYWIRIVLLLMCFGFVAYTFWSGLKNFMTKDQ